MAAAAGWLAMSRDTDAMAVLAAEREVDVVKVIATHAALSEIALERITEACDVIRAGLNARRPELALTVRSIEAGA
jgi:hypothetical protein